MFSQIPELIIKHDEYLSESGEHRHEYRFSDYDSLSGKLFVFYKKFISSQDSGNCMFYPSCSEYAVIAIKKHGLLGLVDAFDRLARCNGIGKKDYPRDKKTGRFKDFPE